MLLIESFAHNSGRNLEWTKYGYIQMDLQTPTVTEESRRNSSEYSVHLSAHPNGLLVNLAELPDNGRLRRHMPNDVPTIFLV
jgi:hypothetical protein